jgi:Predicted metal-binding protein
MMAGKLQVFFCRRLGKELWDMSQSIKAIKLGIITCSTATQEMDCCSVSCLRDFNLRLGGFRNYPSDQPLRLVGLISCAGCPTRVYPEKILRKVDSLVRFGVTSLHFSNCLAAFCPFVNTYHQVISKRYPELELIGCTHEKHISDEEFRGKLRCAFESNLKIPDIILGKV